MASVNWMVRMILKPLVPKLASNQPINECLLLLPHYQLYVDLIKGIVGALSPFFHNFSSASD